VTQIFHHHFGLLGTDHTTQRASNNIRILPNNNPLTHMNCWIGLKVKVSKYDILNKNFL